MPPLEPIRQELLDIVCTPYTDIIAKISDILDFVERQPEDIRAGLIGDVVCWWNLVPMDQAHTNAIRLPFTKRNRTEADETLETLIVRHELSPDDAFEQNLPPDRVGALVLEQLAKAKAHGQLIELEFFYRILSDRYVPYVGHVILVDANPATADEIAAAGLAHTEELLVLESIFRNPNPFSTLSAWAVRLVSRTDEQTARLLIGYAFAKLMMLTRTAMQQQMSDGMPVMIRLGVPEGDEPPDDDSGSDPKRSN